MATTWDDVQSILDNPDVSEDAKKELLSAYAWSHPGDFREWGDRAEDLGLDTNDDPNGQGVPPPWGPYGGPFGGPFGGNPYGNWNEDHFEEQGRARLDAATTTARTEAGVGSQQDQLDDVSSQTAKEGGGGVDSADVILDQGSEGLRFFETYIPRFNAVGGSENLDSVKKAYDAERGMSFSTFRKDAQAVADVGSALDVTVQDLEGQYRALDRAWDDAAGQAAQNYVDALISTAEPVVARLLADGAGSVPTAIRTCVDGMESQVLAKAQWVLAIDQDLNLQTYPTLRPNALDLLIRVYHGEHNDDLLRQVARALDLPIDEECLGSDLTESTRQLAIKSAMEAVEQFKTYFGGQRDAFYEQMKITKDAVDQYYDAMIQAFSDLPEDSFQQLPSLQPPDTTTPGETAPPADATPDVSTGDPATTNPTSTGPATSDTPPVSTGSPSTTGPTSVGPGSPNSGFQPPTGTTPVPGGNGTSNPGTGVPVPNTGLTPTPTPAPTTPSGTGPSGVPAVPPGTCMVPPGGAIPPGWTKDPVTGAITPPAPTTPSSTLPSSALPPGATPGITPPGGANGAGARPSWLPPGYGYVPPGTPLPTGWKVDPVTGLLKGPAAGDDEDSVSVRNGGREMSISPSLAAGGSFDLQVKDANGQTHSYPITFDSDGKPKIGEEEDTFSSVGGLNLGDDVIGASSGGGGGGGGMPDLGGVGGTPGSSAAGSFGGGAGIDLPDTPVTPDSTPASADQPSARPETAEAAPAARPAAPVTGGSTFGASEGAPQQPAAASAPAGSAPAAGGGGTAGGGHAPMMPMGAGMGSGGQNNEHNRASYTVPGDLFGEEELSEWERLGPVIGERS